MDPCTTCKCGWDGVWPSLEPTAAAVSDGVASSTLCGAQPLPLAPFSRAFWFLPHYVSLMLVPLLPAPFPPLTGLPLAAFAFAVLACLPVPLS
jgi:hypothetical protein